MRHKSETNDIMMNVQKPQKEKVMPIKTLCKNIEQGHQLTYIKHEEEKYIIWKEKREYEKQRCEEVEKLYTAKETREFYQNTNSI
jgi:hypothetical protein